MINQPKVLIKKLHPNAKIPTRATNGSVGFDLYAIQTMLFEPDNSEIYKIPTGITMHILPHPDSAYRYEAQVRPRSGLSLQGFSIVNSPGTIDEDYRGEICLLMKYTDENSAIINNGDRIAQLVFNETIIPELELTDIIETSERGDGGFGHTGK